MADAFGYIGIPDSQPARQAGRTISKLKTFLSRNSVRGIGGISVRGKTAWRLSNCRPSVTQIPDIVHYEAATILRPQDVIWDYSMGGARREGFVLEAEIGCSP